MKQKTESLIKNTGDLTLNQVVFVQAQHMFHSDPVKYCCLYLQQGKQKIDFLKKRNKAFETIEKMEQIILNEKGFKKVSMEEKNKILNEYINLYRTTKSVLMVERYIIFIPEENKILFYGKEVFFKYGSYNYTLLKDVLLKKSSNMIKQYSYEYMDIHDDAIEAGEYQNEKSLIGDAFTKTERALFFIYKKINRNIENKTKINDFLVGDRSFVKVNKKYINDILIPKTKNLNKINLTE